MSTPRLRYSLLLLLSVYSGMLLAQSRPKVNTNGTVHLVFINKVGNRPLVLKDSVYTNPFGETYTVSKFLYYISNIKMSGAAKPVAEKNSYHLLDQRDTGSLQFSFPAPAGEYTSIHFLVGVDSIKNVTGIQAGPLDPARDMFWTWLSGYIMAKLEGRSPASTAPDNRFEYHIGGYSGVNNSIRNIDLPFPADNKILVKKGKVVTLFIEADINQWWNSSTPLHISTTPVCAVPGEDAKRIADNYAHMFSIKKINAD